MTDDPEPAKPLHVQVAEALDWRLFRPDLPLLVSSIFANSPERPYRTTVGEKFGGWAGIPPNTEKDHFEPPEARETVGISGARMIPRFDEDWSLAGPLIEEYEIGVQEDGLGYTMSERWNAEADFYHETADSEYGGFWDTVSARGPTAIIAVCNLIVAMHQKQKSET